MESEWMLGRLARGVERIPLARDIDGDDSCEHGDELSCSGATELAILNNVYADVYIFQNCNNNRLPTIDRPAPSSEWAPHLTKKVTFRHVT
jgi:hypothetical protein